MSFELGHLGQFFQVARHKSFTRAAKALRVQQPTVSRGVKLLEDALGGPLFERQPRGVALTPLGERVYVAAARLFEEADNIQRIADAARGELRGPLRIAAAGAVASRLAPDAIAALTTAHPEVWPMVFSGPASLAADQIASGDLELGLYFYAERLPATLEVRPLIDVRFHLVVSRERQRDRAVLASFIGSREVEGDRVRSFPALETWRRVVPDARIRISTNDIEAHLRMVEGGLGVSILPRFVVEEGLRAKTLVDVLPDTTFEFPLLLVTRTRRVLSAAAAELVSAVISSLAGATRKSGARARPSPTRRS
jgi:DNA-binding transcriptional LysR family regulator